MSDKRSTQDRKTLLMKIPAGTERIQVRDEKGKLRYRRVGELHEKDIIQVKKNGNPVVMRNTPGRRETQTKVGPVTPVVRKLMENKEKTLEDDTLLNMAKECPESTDVLQQVMVGLANEAASIRFERMEAERQGKETSSLSMRRINALRAVGDTWLRRKEQIVSRTIDMDSPGFAILFRFIMETFRGSLEESELSSDKIKAIFARLGKTLGSDGWRQEAKNRMKRDL